MTTTDATTNNDNTNNENDTNQSNDGSGTNTGTNTGSGTQDRNWRALEEKATKNEEQASKWRTSALEMAARSAGYDTDKGITQRLIKDFSGDEVSPEKFLEFAKGEGLEPHSIQEQRTQEQATITSMDQMQQTHDQTLNSTNKDDRVKPDLRTQQADKIKEGRTEEAIGLALGEDIKNFFK